MGDFLKGDRDLLGTGLNLLGENEVALKGSGDFDLDLLRGGGGLRDQDFRFFRGVRDLLLGRDLPNDRDRDLVKRRPFDLDLDLPRSPGDRLNRGDLERDRLPLRELREIMKKETEKG